MECFLPDSQTTIWLQPETVSSSWEEDPNYRWGTSSGAPSGAGTAPNGRGALKASPQNTQVTSRGNARKVCMMIASSEERIINYHIYSCISHTCI